ncbi:MAG: plasmid mobilization relaxosome protein MobC [Flavobacteriales bacterium]|nr:plasmid mobilization relaxosome protein MobC [Flavobacteriales bacterium]
MPRSDEKRKRARERKERFLKRNRTYSVSFPNQQARELTAHTAKKGYTVNSYLKALVKSDMEGTGYVLPNDEKLKDMAVQFRKVGTNINQVVRHINTCREVSMQDIQRMQQLLMQLEGTVVETMTLPPNILDVLKQYILNNPNDYQRIKQWFHDHQGIADTEL